MIRQHVGYDHNRTRNRLLFTIALLLALAVTACQTPAPATPTPAPATPTPAPAADYHPSPVVLWNEVMLAAIRSGRPRPVVVARQLFMVHSAMYDAWSLYDPVATPTVLDPALRRPAAEHTLANKSEAVSQAAYQMLLHFFPQYETTTFAFSSLLGQLGYERADAADTQTPAGLGYLAAEAIIADRADDGSNEANNYADLVSDVYGVQYVALNAADPTLDNAAGGAAFDPNHWQPLRVPTGTKRDAEANPIVDNADSASYADQGYLTPHWGAVRPFALTSGAQFRPPAPPQYGSDEPYTDGLGNTMTNDEAYKLQCDEILTISAGLTDEQKVITKFWADGPRSETPPGHWNALAHGISFRDRNTLDDDIKLYFALNGAVFDASISAWDAKRTYDYIRPVSAIRHMYNGKMIEAWGGPNRGTQQISGETWLPYQSLDFLTPPFAEYVSGHSTFSAASAAVLTLFTGSDRFYDGETVLYNEDFNRDGIPDLLGEYVALVNAPVGVTKIENVPAAPVILRWPTFQDAADQAGISRRYGGIHFQDGDLRGRAMGSEIGQQAFALAEQYWTGGVTR